MTGSGITGRPLDCAGNLLFGNRTPSSTGFQYLRSAGRAGLSGLAGGFAQDITALILTALNNRFGSCSR